MGHIHLHPSGDEYAEFFSKGTIKNGGEGDEWIMTYIDDINYYVVTPKGKVKMRDTNGNNALVGYFKENGDLIDNDTGKPVTSNNSLFPFQLENGDMPLSGEIYIPWGNYQIPRNRKKDAVSSGMQPKQCNGCYEEIPSWISRKIDTDVKKR